MRQVLSLFLALLASLWIAVGDGYAACVSWSATTSFPDGRYAHSSVAYNGYLYVIGGNAPGGDFFGDVQFASINSDGTVGSWSATTSLPFVRSEHTSVAQNGKA